MLPDISWLFTHSVVIHHYQSDAWGELATPVPATTTTTGHFQQDSRIVRDSNGQEVVSAGIVYLPGDVSVSAQDQIEIAGGTYRVLFIATPRSDLDAPAFQSVRVI